jgi:hypothetical protein
MAYLEENIKADLKETVNNKVDWLHLIHDTVQGRVLVNTVMILGFHKTGGIP